VSLTWHQDYPGGRIVARSGRIDVGAVFPFGDGSADWRMWFGRFPNSGPNGHAPSELRAKNALADAWSNWVRMAALNVKDLE
jgi:hypothetical protein